jgi:hypothetical protein
VGIGVGLRHDPAADDGVALQVDLERLTLSMRTGSATAAGVAGLAPTCLWDGAPATGVESRFAASCCSLAGAAVNDWSGEDPVPGSVAARMMAVTVAAAVSGMVSRGWGR